MRPLSEGTLKSAAGSLYLPFSRMQAPIYDYPVLAPLDAQRRAMFGALMEEHIAGGGMILAAVHDPLPIEARVQEIGA